jgi:high-affinity nickel-transport protein
LLGFALGLRHALEADHLVAVATIVSRERGLARATLLGALWGAGHSLSLLAVGVAVVLLGVPLPASWSHLLEIGVGGMLIGLGLSSLPWRVRGRAKRPAPDRARVGGGKRPFLVGVMHGLAGSGALAILVLATIRSPVQGVLYIGLFGCGSIGGMMAMSAILSLPFALAARGAGGEWMSRATGLASVAFGVYYVVLQG